ncbi:choice-of-anchor L domain-containing protein, partial [Haloflavibacter putidus]
MKLKLLFLIASLFSFSQSVLAQNDIIIKDATIETCSGNFYDQGGPDGTYSSFDEVTKTMTICPDVDGDRTRVDFSEFLIAAGQDYLYIYDGDSTAAPLIGSYTASNNPGTVIASASNPSGCLTFEFVLDGNFSPLPGWEAEISCEPPCQQIYPEVVSVSPATEVPGGNYTAGVLVDLTFEGSAFFENDGSGAIFQWNFGDGSGAFGETVTYSYGSVGTYQVTLTVVDPSGCSSSITFDITIEVNFVSVDSDLYTIDELVEDVLINNPCAQISNITSSTGTDFGDVNGIGYFDSNGSAFPIESGIVLYSGHAENDVPGPETGIQSSGGTGWPGDPDLTALIQDIENNNSSHSENASIIEFDFVTFADEISFNFLFSSDEYGTYQCSFSDIFAFFLTDENGNTENIALVPGTNTPVSVRTVRDDAYNGSCSSENPLYFDKYYGAGGENEAFAPIDQKGNTVLMTAQSAVTPGETYHIKLAVADRNDTAYNSAVFLEAGSFDVGEVNLGGDLTVENGEATCQGNEVILDIGLSVIPGVVITWYLDGTVIPGETGPTLVVTEEGTYTAEFEYLGACQSTDQVVVEFQPTPMPEEVLPEDLFTCGNVSTITTFDLTINNDNVLAANQDPNNFLITYYTSQAAADAGVNPIENPEEYELASAEECETVYIRVEGYTNETLSGCYEVEPFEVCEGSINVGSNLDDLEECDNDNDGFAIFDLTANEALALDGLDPADFQVEYFESQGDADAGTDAITTPDAFENTTAGGQTIYVRVSDTDEGNCNASDNSFEITALEVAETNEAEPINFCYQGGGETVELTQNETTILGSQDPADFSFSYYESQAEADAGDPATAIPDPSAYEPAIAQDCTSIYVRIENTDNADCFTTTS